MVTFGRTFANNKVWRNGIRPKYAQAISAHDLTVVTLAAAKHAQEDLGVAPGLVPGWVTALITAGN